MDKLLQQLKKDGNEIKKTNTSSNIKAWPFVTLNDDNFADQNYLDKIFDKL